MSAQRCNTPICSIAVLAAAIVALALFGCSNSGNDEATGADFTPAQTVAESTYDAAVASGDAGVSVDSSHASDGYIGIAATANSRLKALLSNGQSTYSYDVPQDGTPIICPLNMGDGSYLVRVMQNTSGSNYVELYRTTVEVSLSSEFAPFLHPNVYCSYNANSECVTQARELVKDCKNQGQALEAICTWIVDNVSYDNDKAQQLKDASGYVPDPDSTLQSKTGICFDYASLGAAMLRSQGIPAQIVTGYVSPQNIYHAWIMVYIDGTWTSAQFSVDANTWSRVDLTFAANSDNENVGDGKEYSDRYVY